MSVEPFEWDNAEWALVTNKYGKLLTYNLPRYNSGYATLTYQGYITEMIESDKYHTFVDVGAFVGLFSLIASHHCKNVIAYEAHPFYYGILLLNMRELINVYCKYKYVGVEGEVPNFNDDDLKGLVTCKGTMPYNIDIISLDSQWYGAVPTSTLIKLDAEGSEIDVLEGSKEILKKPYVHWIIDVHTQHGIEPDFVLDYFPNRKITMISPKVIKVEGLK